MVTIQKNKNVQIMDYQQILKDIYQEIQPYASIGK
ncbi:MAG: glutaminase, partial [Phocaeicola sp.]|nr:glutaminase [Phocaeicola sp.]